MIKWYEGDRFKIDFEVIDDETGEPYILKDGETIEVAFHRTAIACRPIKTFVFDNSANCAALTCEFDEQTTKLFPAGKYTYCVKLNSAESRITISANNVAEVEKCH